MDKFVLWKEGVGGDEEKIPWEHLEEVEEELGIRFPESYVQIVLEHNGGIPVPGYYEVEGPNGKKILNGIQLIFFEPDEFPEEDNFVKEYRYHVKEYGFPEGVYPFAEGEGWTCFDYRNAPDGEPKIVWWSYKLDKKTFYPVCDTFSELLNKLRFEFEWIDVREPVSRDRVQEVEKEWGISLPEDYVQCVMDYNGGRPVPDNRFWYKERKGIFNGLLSFDGDEPEILTVYDRLRERIAAGVYPVGRVKRPGGDICLDYRESSGEEPRVVFWNLDEDVYYKVDDRFVGFLKGLIRYD